MNVSIHQLALKELFEAAFYLEEAKNGLGANFREEIGVAITAISEAPRRWPEIRQGVRRYRLDRFRYSLVYRIRRNRTIEIIAVAHQHRQPGYWSSRLKTRQS